MTGYLFTKYGSEALGLFDDPRIRFAARLSDGSGFAAFDGESLDLMEHGTVMLVQNHIPIPLPFCPKRAIATGREVYSLVSKTFTDYLLDQEAVTGLALVTDELLLVESQGPIVAGSSWSAAVGTFRDKRLERVNA